MDIKFLISIFPIVFMLHDFEEIIFFKAWLNKNKALLQRRFPRLSRRVLPHLEKLSTAAFRLAVAEEFLLLSIITYLSLWWEQYLLWFAIFMAFSIHLVGHIIQWIVFRQYIPSIVTAFLSLPYCIYTFNRFLSADILNAFQMLGWTIAGFALMVVNLFFAHQLALRFEKWQSKKS